MTRDCYAIELIKSALDQLAPQPIWGQKSIDVSRTPPYKIEILRPFLPYLLHSVSDWEHDWIVLNRDYKPLGLSEGSWINYPDYSWLRIRKDATTMPPEESNFINPLDVNSDCFFFFSDKTYPRTRPLIQEYINRVRFSLNI